MRRPDYSNYKGRTGLEDITIVERAPWNDDQDNDWLLAFEAVDAHGSKSLLLKLLRSDAVFTRKVRSFLADLLWRYNLVIDRGSSLPDCNEIWCLAIKAIDTRKDKEPLLELLRSDTEIGSEERARLADFLARHKLKKRRGKPPTPAYDRSEADTPLELAKIMVRERRAGVTRKAAIASAAEHYGVTIKKLKLYLAGRLGSSQRKAKRRR